jgi:CIC family chloride channel protein
MSRFLDRLLQSVHVGRGRPWALYALAFRAWLAERFQYNSARRTLLWAGLVGALGGLSAVAFRTGTNYLHLLLTNQTGGMVETFSKLPVWQRLLTPALGGAVAGVIILFGQKIGRGSNKTDYMEAVVLGNGLLSFRSSLVKCFSAAFSIASGGSIGREGPMVQMSALLASLVGRFRKWPSPRRRLIVACGAAAGIASAYNAPIAGALFVSEIVLKSISMETLGPLVFATVMATQVVHYLSGGNPLYQIPTFSLNSSWELILFLNLGILAGFLSPLFLYVLRLSKRSFNRLALPPYLQIGLGGLVVGMLAIWYPQVCGNGYSVVSSILNQQVLWQGLGIILLFKVLATCASFGSGAVGGVFTPTLFVGASLGYLFGQACHALFGGTVADPGAFALVGMGVFLAATTHAPLMAILMIFEMTLDYQIVMPLMLGSVMAYYIAHAIDSRSIYHDVHEGAEDLDYVRSLSRLRVEDLMRSDPVSVREDSRFAEIAQSFISHNINYLYVMDRTNVFKGAIALHDIKTYLNMPELADLVIAREILNPLFPSVGPDASLSEALNMFARHDGERLPVLDREDHRLLGSLTKGDVLLALAQKAAVGNT